MNAAAEAHAYLVWVISDEQPRIILPSVEANGEMVVRSGTRMPMRYLPSDDGESCTRSGSPPGTVWPRQGS